MTPCKIKHEKEDEFQSFYDFFFLLQNVNPWNGSDFSFPFGDKYRFSDVFREETLGRKSLIEENGYTIHVLWWILRRGVFRTLSNI